MSAKRWPALGAILVALVGLALASSWRDPRPSPSFGRTTRPAIPTAAAVGSRSSTWFCAAGSANAASPLHLTVVIANASTEPRSARVTWYPTTGAPVTRAVQVPANDAVSIVASTVVTSETASAMVEVDGGGVAVEHAITGANGYAIAPCASETSARWYFPVGVTERDAREVIALFNPFPADAVVDLHFLTESGRVDPPEGQGLLIPAHSTIQEEVGNLVRRRATATLEVVARTGEVVADRVQLFDGTNGRRGAGLDVGAPRGALRWEFPDGLVEASTVFEGWVVYNPTGGDAEVTLTVDPVTGESPPPLDLTIPAHSQHTISASDAGIGASVAHSSTIESQNGVAVVAERVVDLRAPSPRVGWSAMIGAPVAARSWIFPIGSASAQDDEWLVVRNPGRNRVSVDVIALAHGVRLPIEGMQHLEVGGGGRLAIRLGDHIQRSPLPLVVQASGDVVVERDLYRVGVLGVSTSLGIPLP